MDKKNDSGNQPIQPRMRDGLTNEQLTTALLLVHEKYVTLLANDDDLDDHLLRVVDLFNTLQYEYLGREYAGDTDDLLMVANGDLLLFPSSSSSRG